MRMRVIAVGTRMSGWVSAAFDDYAKRLKPTLPLELTEISTRTKLVEAKKILEAVGPRDHLVALDEQGKQFSSVELAHWLEQRRQSGQDLVFVIGGPDGLAAEIFERSQQRWSLSRLTLPHGMVRVLLAEQLYRASTILSGHPYHRA